MLAWLGERASALGLEIGGAAFLLLAALEARAPLRPASAVASRWITNFGLYVLALVLVAAVAPGHLPAALGLGHQGPVARLGEGVLVLAAGFLLLDLLGYAAHRIQHLRPFWRFHHVHHADQEMDASTAIRHHPGEFLINAALGAVAMAALGIPLWVVPIYAVVAQLADLAQHANLALPPRLDRLLSLVVMTPGAHRVHHSDSALHYDTNFGTVLTIWDRLFGTWHPQVEGPLRFGVPGAGVQGPLGALTAPFRRVG